MASLADLRKLGASLVSHEGASEASNWGPSLVTDDDMSHLGAIAEHEVATQVAMDARLAGIWEGSTSQELGAYKQRIEFKNDCLHAEVGNGKPKKKPPFAHTQQKKLGVGLVGKGSVSFGHCKTQHSVLML